VASRPAGVRVKNFPPTYLSLTGITLRAQRTTRLCYTSTVAPPERNILMPVNTRKAPKM
jgi:hypothetical protein